MVRFTVQKCKYAAKKNVFTSKYPFADKFLTIA